jgi:hypothetical protein
MKQIISEWPQLIIDAKKKGGSRHFYYENSNYDNNCNSINRFQYLPGRPPEERVPPHPQIS